MLTFSSWSENLGHDILHKILSNSRIIFHTIHIRSQKWLVLSYILMTRYSILCCEEWQLKEYISSITGKALRKIILPVNCYQWLHFPQWQTNDSTCITWLTIIFYTNPLKNHSIFVNNKIITCLLFQNYLSVINIHSW